MTELVTVGWLTLDDIVLLDGACERNVVGGGALYSAVGAAIWNDAVGIHSVTGVPHLDYVRGAISDSGLDATGIAAIDGNGLELWVLHESETDKQQIPKLTSSTAIEMDEGRGPLPAHYAGARGFHIAPQGSRSTLENIARLASLPSRPIVTVDVLADDYSDPQRYEDAGFIAGVSAFLPSDAEIRRIWKPESPESWIVEQARRFSTHVAIKLGGDGSLVCAAGGERIVHVPALTVDVVDTTGAGDAYCGGFLAGLVAGRPIEECAAMGTVAASYVVETRGALSVIRPESGERAERLAAVMAGLSTRQSS